MVRYIYTINIKALKTNKTPIIRKSAKKTSRPIVKPRPLRKRVLLHPFSVMVLLCTGVIIAGSTLQGTAASYDVTASVHAPVPPAPAFIAQPDADQHLTSSTVTVAGACPPQTYVKVFRNAAFMGAVQCSRRQSITGQSV
jgi:hypothetical protein